MQINNPFQMTDWPIKRFIIVVQAIQFAMWGSIGLDIVGLHIPIIRSLIGFIYLIFIPGALILRILKMHKLDSIETILFSVGLSITTLMFVGLSMNTLYPLIGISKPISLTPLIITISIVVLILSVLCYVIDKDFHNSSSSFIDVRYFLSSQALFLYHIPFLAIFGTYLVNYYANNIIVILLLIVIAIIIFLGNSDKVLQKKYYSLAIFVIAISLLYHTSLISMYLVEWADISFEHWYAKLVLLNSIWDPMIYSNVNAMLGITMLAPIFAIICDLKLIWVFKIIYPALFSLVPLGLYQIFQKQTDTKIAFLSIYFFMSMFSFYTDMLGLARQQIAELYFTLIIMLMINDQMVKTKKSFLLIIFMFSMTVSHYSLSYIYLATIISAWILLILVSNQGVQNFTKKNTEAYRFGNTWSSHNPNAENIKITTTFVMLSIIGILSWYMYVSNSSSLSSIVHIINNITNTIFSEFLSKDTTQGLEILLTKSEAGFIGSIYKMIHLITQFSIAIGVVHALLKWKSTKFHLKYLAISIPFLGMVIAGLIIPHVASSINTSRLYGISLLILSPFCVTGAIFIMEIIGRITKFPLNSKNIFTILCAFFAVYFLFNSGFIYEFAGHPSSLSLNQTAVNRTIFELQEVNSIIWLDHNIASNKIVYADARNVYLVQTELGYFYPLQKTREGTRIIPNDTYIFFGEKNIKEGTIWLDDPLKPRLNTTSVAYENSTLSNTIDSMSEIFNNGNAKVYYY